MQRKNPNRGHRDRLRKKYFENGIESFEEHEILELMLFSVIPMGNTNHTGHNLIDSCGGIEGVFDTDKETLKNIDGVGEAAAELIRFQRDMFDVYETGRKQDDIPKFTQQNGMKLIKDLFCERPDVSRFYMILLGSENKIISVETICEGKIDYENISVRKIVSRAVRLDAIRVVFAHNHPNGNIMPSDSDILFTKKIDRVLSYADIEMNDHIVVAGNTAVSIRNDMRALG